MLIFNVLNVAERFMYKLLCAELAIMGEFEAEHPEIAKQFEEWKKS